MKCAWRCVPPTFVVANKGVMVYGVSKGLAKAAAELVRTEPQHLCSSWTRSDLTDSSGKLCLETRIQLRARRHAVEFQVDTLHFPHYYKVTPSSGVIAAGSSVMITVRLRYTEKTRRTKFQHTRGSALWTDLRVHVRRHYGEGNVEPPATDTCQRGSAFWAQEKLLDADHLREIRWHPQADGPRINKRSNNFRKNSYSGDGRALYTLKRDRVSMHQSATFVKILKLQPLVLSQGSDCIICIEEMNVQRHAAGNGDERLFAFGCGHIFHTHCVAQMVEAFFCLGCPLCRRPISWGEIAILKPSDKIISYIYDMEF